MKVQSVLVGFLACVVFPASLLAGPRIDADVDDGESRARHKAVYPVMATVLDGYISNAKNDNVRRWARSQKMQWAVEVRAWKDARDLLDADPNDLSVFDEITRLPDRLDPAGYVALMASGLGEKASAANAIEDSTQRRTALETLRPELKADAQASAWLERRIASADLQEKLAGGEWVDLPIDTQLTYWSVRQGEWTVDEQGRLTGTSSGDLEIVCHLELPKGYEFRCVVERVGDLKYTNAAVVTVNWKPGQQFGFWVDAGNGSAYVFRNMMTIGKRFKFESRETGVEVFTRVEPTRITNLATTSTPQSIDIEDRYPRSRGRISFGGQWTERARGFRFSNVQIRAIP